MNHAIANPVRGKAVFFLPSLGGGGAEMHLLRVINHAEWEGLEPHLLLARSGGAYEAQLRPGIPCEHLLPTTIRSSAASMMLAARPLRRRLQELRPAAVCSLLNHTTVVLHWALQGWGPQHGPRPRLLIGIQNNPSQDLAQYRTLLGRWFRGRLERALAAADGIVALSRGVADDFKKHFPPLAERVTLIYNAGYDEHVIRSAAESVTTAPMPQSGRFLLVTCGRLTKQKNHALLLRALAQVRKQIDARLWLLGEGALRPGLEKLAQELGLAPFVQFHGFKTNPFKYLAQADAFVLSSDWEGFGNVLVEAMALGVPVISTACPYGPAEIITDGRNGLLVQPGSVEALAGAIIRLSNQPELAAELGRAGWHRSHDFHPATIAAEYGVLLNRLIRQPASTGGVAV